MSLHHSALEHELLSVYREALSSHFRERKLQDEVEDLRDRLKVRDEEIERLEKRVSIQASRFKVLDEMNAQQVVHIIGLNDALDACLDLVGAVIEQDALIDSLAWLEKRVSIQASRSKVLDEMNAQQVVDAGGVRIMPLATDNEPGRDPMPMFCLSCNGDKDGFYLCTECFELSIDHGCDLFTELQDAWDNGDRMFPRPNKNAKELYKK